MSQLTKEQVVHVLGPDVADDRTVMAIIDTCASEDELCEAYNLFIRGSDLDAERQRAASERVNAICSLLAELDAGWDEEPTRGR